MMARSTTSSNQRPDTLMQDRLLATQQNLLRRTAGPYISGQSQPKSHTGGIVAFGPRTSTPYENFRMDTEECDPLRGLFSLPLTAPYSGAPPHHKPSSGSVSPEMALPR